MVTCRWCLGHLRWNNATKTHFRPPNPRQALYQSSNPLLTLVRDAKQVLSDLQAGLRRPAEKRKRHIGSLGVLHIVTRLRPLGNVDKRFTFNGSWSVTAISFPLMIVYIHHQKWLANHDSAWGSQADVTEWFFSHDGHHAKPHRYKPHHFPSGKSCM